MRTRLLGLLVFPLVILLGLAACASVAPPLTATLQAPTAIPSPMPTPDLRIGAFDGVAGIVDPTNFGWPRQVEGVNGTVSIPSKPARIITASIGHDEMTLALVPVERLVGVGSVSKDPTYSNVSSLVQNIPEISREPETIISRSPDVIVTSPFYPADTVAALSQVGIPVIQTDLEQHPEGRINSILLMGYIYGEEERALAFASEVSARYDSVVSVTSEFQPRPRVLALTRYSDTLWVAGGNSTEGSIISTAGAINAAEEAGVDGNQTISLEGVIAMAPEIVIIPQPAEFGAEEFRQSLLNNEALAETPAIANNRVYIVDGKLFTTLSQWNLRGVEEMARLLWPDHFPDPAGSDFSLPE